ncbi:MAG: type II toxin-antitoxin system RelE/ParE family toxin [Candidatus Electrothrix sp. AR1]|nr:type II toxin-antitoxin system RelE/ParE family toxin [Candidatus Electrothrix sp. AR1]
MSDLQEIIQSLVFAKQKNKLKSPQKKDLDTAVRVIFDDPAVGKMKFGDLSGLQVYKYTLTKQQVLIAYEVNGETLFLYAFGSHENFYRDLKKYLHG